jgi:hypothetical protein
VLKKQITVERVLATRLREPGEEEIDLQLLVISPSFEGMAWTDRSDLLAQATLQVLPDYVTAWGYTPSELDDAMTGKGRDGLLSMALSDTREVYHKAPAGSDSR